jgi:uncharacterized protein YceK
MLRLLTLALIASLSGCATLGQMMESKETKRKRASAEKDKTKYETWLAKAKDLLATAKGVGLPTASQEAWEKAELAWRRAHTRAKTAMNKCASTKRYDQGIQPYCPQFKPVYTEAAAGYAQFLAQSAASPEVAYFWLQRRIFDAENTSNLTAQIDGQALLRKLAKKKRAHFTAELSKVESLRNYVKRKTVGTCSFAKTKFSPNIHSTNKLSYLFGEPDQLIHIGCITKNKRSLYRRDQPDRLVLSYWWHGRYVQLHTLPLESAGATDELSAEVAAEALITAMDQRKRRSPKHFKWPGEWIWLKASYVVSHKDGFHWTRDRSGRRVARPSWRHKTIADGTFYFKYVR